MTRVRSSACTVPTPWKLRSIAVVLSFWAVLQVPGAAAQSEVGAFASIVGTVEVQRSSPGEWNRAFVGAPVLLSDQIRTGAGGFAKIVFLDDSVVDLAENTQITVEKYEVDRQAAKLEALVNLATGKLRGMAGEQYGLPEALYEIETPTAVVRVRGPALIVLYDPNSETTDVAVVEGTAAVQGAIGLIGPSVQVGAQELTSVKKGQFPTPVRAVDAAQLAQLEQGLETVGTGGRDGLAAGHRVVGGSLLQPDERPQALAAVVSPSAAGVSDESYLNPRAPGENLIDRLSVDVRANTQPILEYEFSSPIDPPPGP